MNNTPGPWRLGLNGAVVTDNDVGHDNAETRAWYGGNVICESVTESNARVIIACPELLTAVDLFLDRMNRFGYWEDGCFYYGGKSASEFEEVISRATEAIDKAEGK